MQEDGLTNEGRHNILLLHKQAEDKRGIAESLISYIRARLTACKVGILREKYANGHVVMYYIFC